ncbi:TetR/AcrR family transcriptional regulator [Streptomyces sp. NPDC002386]
MAGGRPRAFDADQALDRAMEVFWRQGFEGTSISDLTNAMGINPPSLYATFGNKQELFRKVLDRYAEGPAHYIQEAFSQPTARTIVEQLLHGAADATTDPRYPSGCMTVQGGLACAPASQAAQEELAARRKAGEVALHHRLELAQSCGELPPGSDPAGLAAYFSTVYQGIAVQAAGGASRERLHEIVDLALQAWPQPEE